MRIDRNFKPFLVRDWITLFWRIVYNLSGESKKRVGENLPLFKYYAAGNYTMERLMEEDYEYEKMDR